MIQCVLKASMNKITILILLTLFLTGCDSVLTTGYQIHPKSKLPTEKEAISLFHSVNSVLTEVEKDCGRYYDPNDGAMPADYIRGPYFILRGGGLTVFLSDKKVGVNVFVWNPGMFISWSNSRFVGKVEKALKREFPGQVITSSDSDEPFAWPPIKTEQGAASHAAAQRP